MGVAKSVVSVSLPVLSERSASWLCARSARLLVAGAVTFAASCGGSSGGDEEGPFTVKNTAQAIASGGVVGFSGDQFAYLASEATSASGGVDLNGDSDSQDSVLQILTISSGSETNLGVAVDEFHWLDDGLYLVVDESEDEVDWDGDGDSSGDDLSLLYWTSGMTTPEFIAALEDEGTQKVVVVDERLFFAEEAESAPGLGLSSLAQIEVDAPELPLPVTTSSDAPNGLQPRLFGQDEELVFGYVDETIEGVDLNDDGDATDEVVLVLLDGTLAGPEVHVTGLGLAPDDDPVLRANKRAENDWLVAVLVSEQAHVTTLTGTFAGFNDPDLFDGAWQPPQCSGGGDSDTEDDVLFWIDFADWVLDPVGNPPQNTGLVGRDRVLALSHHVATISEESAEEDCDLNEDGDSEDRIFRWVEARVPVLPPFDSVIDLLALADDDEIGGETVGIAELDGSFVILADESADNSDLDLDDADHRLLGWRHPDESAEWTFNHGTEIEGTFVDFFGGATWMEETPDRSLLLAAVPENVQGDNLNTLGSDTDTNDSVPAFLSINSQPRLTFPFVRYATEADDAGIIVSKNIAFYRISESADSRDWNGDGDSSDHVLLRTNLSTGETNYMGVASNLARSAIEVDPNDASPAGGAFVVSESAAGNDFNGDGDQSDFVLRWFRM